MMSTVSSTGRQVPLLVDVSTSITCPAVVSAELGTYVAFSVVLFGLNAPEPSVVHMPEPVVDVPLSGVFGEEMQVRIVSPATT